MMNNITYQSEKFIDCMEEIASLAYNHWLEAESDHAPGHFDMAWAAYIDACDANTLLTTTLRINNELVGYVLTTIHRCGHYQTLMGSTCDAFYVKPEYRKGRIGINLFKEMEKQIRARGDISVMYIESKDIPGNRQSKIFDRLGWRLIEHRFSKVITK